MTSDLKMPVLAPLKLRPKHREGYHSKSQMNILISEQNIKTRNAFRHPNICNVNYTKEGHDDNKSSNTGMIVGIVIACVVVIAIIVIVVIFCMKKGQSSK